MRKNRAIAALLLTVLALTALAAGCAKKQGPQTSGLVDEPGKEIEPGEDTVDTQEQEPALPGTTEQDRLMTGSIRRGIRSCPAVSGRISMKT